MLRKFECATRDGGAAILSIRPIPVTTIQCRNAIFSLCDEEFAATCCVWPQLTREQLQPPLHKHSEKARAVPSIASTIEHIGESRLGAQDRSCIRPAIGTQTSWHDIHWLRFSLGPSEAFLVRICKKVAGGSFTDQDGNRSAIFEGIGSFGTAPYSFRTSFPTQILKARATRRSVS